MTLSELTSQFLNLKRNIWDSFSKYKRESWNRLRLIEARLSPQKDNVEYIMHIPLNSITTYMMLYGDGEGGEDPVRQEWPITSPFSSSIPVPSKPSGIESHVDMTFTDGSGLAMLQEIATRTMYIELDGLLPRESQVVSFFMGCSVYVHPDDEDDELVGDSTGLTVRACLERTNLYDDEHGESNRGMWSEIGDCIEITPPAIDTYTAEEYFLNGNFNLDSHLEGLSEVHKAGHRTTMTRTGDAMNFNRKVESFDGEITLYKYRRFRIKVMFLSEATLIGGINLDSLWLTYKVAPYTPTVTLEVE